MAATVTWLGCDLVTGKIIEELPDLTPQGPLQSLLSAYTSAAFTLPIPLGGYGRAADNWLGATQAGRGMVVAVMDGLPVWAGIILLRQGGTAPALSLGCVTLEGYLERRYVTNHTWVGQDEASVIAAGLIADANTTEDINFVVSAAATGTLRDREYFDQDDKSVYDALRELTDVLGGPEWTVLLGWTDVTETAILKTLLVKKRIGFLSALPTPQAPTGTCSAVFSTQGESDARYEYTEDYSTDKGANHIVAVSSGEGEARPQSVPSRDEALFLAGWPRYEYRFSPSSSITSIPVLNDHATAKLALMGRGSQLLTFNARADAFPKLGVDWSAGDDIGYELRGHRHPNGLTGVGRAIGWDLDTLAGTVSPILFAPGAEGS